MPENINAQPAQPTASPAAREAGSALLALEQQGPEPISQGPLVVQAKLVVGAPDDPLEEEADRVAEQVMRKEESFLQRKTQDTEFTPLQEPKQSAFPPKGSSSFTSLHRSPTSASFLQLQQSTVPPVPMASDQASEVSGRSMPPSFLQAKCSECEQEEEAVQRKGEGEPEVGTGFEAQLNSTKGQGSMLPEETRSFMESQIGADFSAVRIHQDAQAQQLSQTIHAQAFTHGSDIYFNTGKYSPESSSGKQLLAHELTHTVQQGAVPQVQTKEESPSVSPISTPQVQRAGMDDEELLPVRKKKVVAKNQEHWDALQLATINPLREITPHTFPHAYANRTWQAQKLVRAAELTLNGKNIGQDGILGPETMIFFTHIASHESQAMLRHQLSGLGFNMEALASDEASAIRRESYISAFKVRLLHQWNVSAPGQAAIDHLAVDNSDKSFDWYISILFDGVLSPQALKANLTLADFHAILKRAYAHSTFTGRAALATANRTFLDNTADTRVLVEQDPGKSAPNPLRITYSADSEKKAANYEEWFGIEYPNTKARQVRKNIGVHKVNETHQVTGLLLAFYLPLITATERARLSLITEGYIKERADDVEAFLLPRTQRIIDWVNDEDTNHYLMPHLIEDALLDFAGRPLVFEKMADKLIAHSDRNYFEALIQKIKHYGRVEPLQLLIQICHQTRFKDHASIVEAHTFLNSLKHNVQAHDYVTGTPDQQGVRINKERSKGSFLKVGDITTGAYRISEEKEYLKEAKRAQLEAKVTELMEAHLRASLDENQAAPSKDMSEKEFTEMILEKAAQEVKITKDDIEKVLVEEAFRIKSVQSKKIQGVEEFFVEYERVARTGGEGNSWIVTEPSRGLETRRDFEESLGWFKFSNTMKATERLVTIQAAIVVGAGGIMFLAAGGGAALIALGGGAKIVGLSIGLSVLIYVITNRKHLTLEGFLKAVLEGYLMAVGLRLFAPVGASAARLIGTATFRQKLLGLLVQGVITGGGSGAFTGAGALFAMDLLNGKMHNPGDYLKAASEGFLMGAMFELGGSLILGPIFRAAGKNVLQRIANIEQLKQFLSKESIALKPSQWGPEITNSFAGFATWLRANVEGKTAGEILKKMWGISKSMVDNYVTGLELTIHRQALDLIEAGMTKESAEALEMLIATSRKSAGELASIKLMDDMLNQLSANPKNVNPFFGIVKAADQDLLAALLKGKNLNLLANAENILALTTLRTTKQVANLLKLHFKADVPGLNAWSQRVLKLADDVKIRILDLLEQRGAAVTPGSLLRIAESKAALSEEVVQGLTRLITNGNAKGLKSANIDELLTHLDDAKIQSFLTDAGTLAKDDLDDILALASQPQQAAQLLNYVNNTGQLLNILKLGKKNVAEVESLFAATNGVGKFADDLEALMGKSGSTTASVKTLVEQFHGHADVARKVLEKLAPLIEKKTLDKMFRNIHAAGPDGIKLAKRLADATFEHTQGYLDLIKKASVDNHSLKAVNQTLDKAEELVGRGFTPDELRFEHDTGTGFHDVDVGVKHPTTPDAYREAYQFKTLTAKLTKNGLQSASAQMAQVNSTVKIIEIRCTADTTLDVINSPGILREMRYQMGLEVAGKGVGITEFRFILSDGTLVVKNASNL